MKTTYEIKSDKNMAKSTLGYGIMWFFTAFLVGILPFLTGHGSSVFYITGSLALAVGVYKTYRGIVQLINT